MNESKATRYQRLRRRAQGAGAGAGALWLLLLAVTPGSRWLSTWAHAASATLPAWLQGGAALVLYVLVVAGLSEIVAIPAVLYLGLHLDRRFKQTDHAVGPLLGAQVQSLALGCAVALAVAMTARISMAVAGGRWWALAGVLMAVGLVAGLRIVPALLSMAGDVKPLSRADLAARVSALARRAGVPILGLYEWRTGESTRATALVTGFGQTRRAVLALDAVRDWTDDEIEVVLAHELAHHKHYDLWRSLVLDALVLTMALWVADGAVQSSATVLGLAGPSDLAALPLLALVVCGVWIGVTPIRHAQSRRHERRADRFALTLTGGVDAFSTAVRRLGARHLHEERPSALTRWLYHRHPSVEERLALARSFRRKVPTV